MMKNKLITLINNWVIDSQLRGLADGTIKYYRREIIGFFEQYPKSPGKVGLPDIKRYCLQFKDKPNKINSFLRGLRSFYRFLTEEGTIEENIMEKVRGWIKVKNGKIPITFSDKETEKIINLPQLSLKEKCILHLLADTGMRNGELCNILIKNIELKENRILLETTKGGDPRYVFFRKNTKNLLEEYLSGKVIASNYLFYNHAGRKEWGDKIGEIVKRAVGIAFPFDPKKRKEAHPHTFRHSFVTSWIRAGGNLIALQHICGWKNLDMLKIYSHLDTEALKSGYNEYQTLKHKKNKTLI